MTGRKGKLRKRVKYGVGRGILCEGDDQGEGRQMHVKWELKGKVGSGVDICERVKYGVGRGIRVKGAIKEREERCMGEGKVGSGVRYICNGT